MWEVPEQTRGVVHWFTITEIDYTEQIGNRPNQSRTICFHVSDPDATFPKQLPALFSGSGRALLTSAIALARLAHRLAEGR